MGSVWGQDADNVVYQYLTSVAGTNTITATGPVGLAAYAAGLKFRFIPAATNTGATTINITGTGSLGARNIFCGGSACVGGELRIGIPVEVTDDGTQFNITGPYSGGKVPGNATFAGTLGVTGAATLSSTLAVTGTITGSSSAVWGTGVANFGTITKRKTADETVTSSAVLQDDDHLTFAIAANEEWVVSYQIDSGDNMSATGIKAAITAPAGAALSIDMTLNAVSTSAQPFGGRATVSGTAALNAAIATGNGNLLSIAAWILNGATPGNVTLQWAQGTSNGNALIFRKGSYMQATRVA